MKRWLFPLIGIIAILSLLGATRPLPPYLSFSLSALAIILFPGIALTRLIAGSRIDQDTLPELLATWFVVGIGAVSAIGLLGLALRLRLSELMPVLIISYAVMVVLSILRRTHSRSAHQDGTGKEPGSGCSAVTIAVMCIAVGSGLLTLLTPRDYDDWYYLAYIKDYVVDVPLAAGDAIFGMGNPVTPRIWFGGGWWVLEALLAKVSGIDPIALHQIYLPILVLPFSVFAVYTLAKHVFRSSGAALIACFLQVWFYLSSAYPYKSTGWMVFARIAQDKAVSCFVVVPLAAALAVRLIREVTEDQGRGQKQTVFLYWFAAFTTAVIHGMGPAWCALLIVPFAFIEWLRSRTAGSARALASVLFPLFACTLILISARGLVSEVVTALAPDPVRTPGLLSSVYLPGDPFRLGTDTTNPITWFSRETLLTLNPLFVTRYPVAIAGLVLSLALIRYLKSSPAARFLLAATATTFLLLFTPTGIRIASWAMTPRLAFRLCWIFPWGFIIAFFLMRLRLRAVLMLILLAAIVLGLARGNPANYVSLFLKMRERNRPSSEAVDAFAFLASQPSPQGVILASESTGRMIPAFLPEGYPVNFRESGPVDRERLKLITELTSIDGTFLEEIERNQVAYILIENAKPLARTLNESNAGFRLEYTNQSYSVWHKVARGDSLQTFRPLD
jgi:hypothetical protein